MGVGVGAGAGLGGPEVELHLQRRVRSVEPPCVAARRAARALRDGRRQGAGVTRGRHWYRWSLGAEPDDMPPSPRCISAAAAGTGTDGGRADRAPVGRGCEGLTPASRSADPPAPPDSWSGARPPPSRALGIVAARAEGRHRAGTRAERRGPCEERVRPRGQSCNLEGGQQGTFARCVNI